MFFTRQEIEMKRIKDVFASVAPSDVAVVALLLEKATFVLANHKKLSDSQMARSLGMPLMQLKSLRYLLGIKKSVYTGSATKILITRERLLRYRADGLSFKDIGKLLGCSKTRVDQLCKSFDVP